MLPFVIGILDTFLVHTVVAEIISPLSASVNIVINRILLSVNNIKPMNVLRIKIDFLSVCIS